MEPFKKVTGSELIILLFNLFTFQKIILSFNPNYINRGSEAALILSAFAFIRFRLPVFAKATTWYKLQRNFSYVVTPRLSAFRATAGGGGGGIIALTRVASLRSARTPIFIDRGFEFTFPQYYD